MNTLEGRFGELGMRIQSGVPLGASCVMYYFYVFLRRATLLFQLLPGSL